MLKIINHGKVRELRLARPPVNALNFDLVTSLTNSVNEAATECEALFISGRDGLFTGGLDVVALMQLDREDMTTFWTAFIKLNETIACSSIPMAAAITGHAPAAGLVISMMCDYRVMSRGKYGIGLNETRVGLIIPAALQYFVGRLIGPRLAEQMLVSGNLVDPEEACKIGLVDALEPDAEAVIAHALNWCEELLSLPRHSMLGNRALARERFKQVYAAHGTPEIEAFIDNWFSAETQDVLNALLARLKK